MTHKLKQNRHLQSGQSMTEFLACASFALVPLFLSISLLAKYIDIKQTNIQASRYQAWEYTVWYANDSQPMTGFEAVDQPIKSTAFTQLETQRRFFTDPGNENNTQAIAAVDGTLGWTTGTSNPLWTDHTGGRLYSGVTGAGDSLRSSEDTPTIPVIGDVMNTLFDIIDFAFSAIGDLMSLVGSSVGFTAINTEGYAQSNMSMQVAINPNFVNIDSIHGARGTSDELTGGTLDFSTSASVLSDAWNAGGSEHVYNQAGGAVPTTLLSELLDAIPGFETVWNVVTVLSPELRLCNPGGIWGPNDKGSLWLGHIDIDAVHPDRLEDGGTHSCDDAGMCDLEPITPRTDDSRFCYD